MDQFDEAMEAIIAMHEAKVSRCDVDLLADGSKREWNSLYSHNLPRDMVCPVCGELREKPVSWQYRIAALTMCLKCWHGTTRRVRTKGIYAARKERGLSQSCCARLINVARQQWNRLEGQSDRVAIYTAVRIAEILPWRPMAIAAWNRHHGPPWRDPYKRPERVHLLGDDTQYHITEPQEPRPTVPAVRANRRFR
jgi:DNA-binding XRE family transcriptional regulator